MDGVMTAVGAGVGVGVGVGAGAGAGAVVGVGVSGLLGMKDGGDGPSVLRLVPPRTQRSVRCHGADWYPLNPCVLHLNTARWDFVRGGVVGVKTWCVGVLST
jgi:hypothetical protein